jgi:hypothetical protein
MKKQYFDRLVEGVRQAGAIRRGEMEPSRVTEFAPIDVRAIRERLERFTLGLRTRATVRKNSP